MSLVHCCVYVSCDNQCIHTVVAVGWTMLCVCACKPTALKHLALTLVHTPAVSAAGSMYSITCVVTDATAGAAISSEEAHWIQMLWLWERYRVISYHWPSVCTDTSTSHWLQDALFVQVLHMLHIRVLIFVKIWSVLLARLGYWLYILLVRAAYVWVGLSNWFCPFVVVVVVVCHQKIVKQTI